MCKTESNTDTTDALKRLPELDELDSSLWNDKCDSIDVERCMNMNPDNYNLLVMQLKIQSLLAHQHELKQLLHTVEKKNSLKDAILLCETFLTRKNLIWSISLVIHT